MVGPADSCGKRYLRVVLAGFLGRRVLIELTYDRRRFEDDTIDRMRQHLHTLLKGMAANPRRILGELPMWYRSQRCPRQPWPPT
jgi:hypothetical protein